MFNEITPNLDQKWLIDDVLPLGGFGLLYAKPNAGKSFVALNMALAISRGTPWHGRDTEQGSSLYISAEGTLADRVAAYRRYYELEGQAPPFALIEDRVNLRDTKADTAPLIEVTHALTERTGHPLRLVVVDTLARVLAGGDENTGQDMGAVIDRLDRIRRETGAAILLVHHEGKDSSKGARGHSSLLAAVDCALEIKDGVLKVEKQRDGQTGARFGFKIRQVPLGTSAKGKAVTSAVAVSTDYGATRDFGPPHLKRGSTAAKALEILKNAIARDGIPAPSVLDLKEETRVVRIRTWREHCGQKKLSGGGPDAERKAFDRAVEKLMQGHIDTHNGFVWIQEVRQ